MIAVAALLHILLVAGFSLQLMWTEGMFGNQADSALATAILVQNVYPWLICPIAIGTSVYCSGKTYRRSAAASFCALSAAVANFIAFGAATTQELGTAVVVVLSACIFSAICLVFLLSRPLRSISPEPEQTGPPNP